MRKILIAMDGSKHSAFAFEWYARNLYRDSDHVIVAYCADHGVNLSRYARNLYRDSDHVIVAYCADHGINLSTIFQSENPGTIQQIIDDYNDQIKKVFRGIEELANKLKIGHIVERLHEPVGESIVKAANQQNVDIIIVGNRGLGKVRRTIMGRTSNYIVHHAHVPVVVCKHAP